MIVFQNNQKNPTVLKIKIEEYVIIQLIKKIKHTINNNLIILINEKYKISIYILEEYKYIIK